MTGVQTCALPIFWNAVYESFGTVHIFKEEVVNNLRFPGQYYDAETGLHYNWHRYYDHGVGRFFRIDPIGIVPFGPKGGANNLYSYANLNPIRNYDQTGLATKSKDPECVNRCALKCGAQAAECAYNIIYVPTCAVVCLAVSGGDIPVCALVCAGVAAYSLYECTKAQMDCQDNCLNGCKDICF